MTARKYIIGVMAAVAAATLTGVASANSVSFAGGSGSDDASVTFTAFATNVLEVTLTNTETGTITVGQGLNGVSFDLHGLSLPTALTSVTGIVFSPTSGAGWDESLVSQSTDLSPSPFTKVDHWGLTTSSPTVTLTALSGGQPDHLIIPTIGTAGSGSSLAGPHSPYFAGPTSFFLTVSGINVNTQLNSNCFANVDFTFGTSGGEGSATATLLTPTVPLPTSVFSGGAMLGALAIGMKMKRRAIA